MNNQKDLKDKLTEEQYRVTQQCGTEPPFQNEYWDNKEPGIYVDIISCKPLFLSSDKFASKSGWPSFTKPVQERSVEEHEDKSHGMTRTEVKSSSSGSHLGHVFDDGPNDQPRYCINSAALRFIPKSKMKEKGYGKYISQIEDQEA